MKTCSYLLVVAIFMVACHKKNKFDSNATPACVADCHNGGTCADNACNCPSDWRGPKCDTFYTKHFGGVYLSDNLDCGQGKGGMTYTVVVDDNDHQHLKIGSMTATLLANGQFLFSQTTPAFTGTGTIDGKQMWLGYSLAYPTVTINCAGTFTRQ